MSAVPPASASGEALAEGAPAPSKGAVAEVLPSLGADERAEAPLESDVRLVVPETDAPGRAAETAAQAIAEDVRVAPTPIAEDNEVAAIAVAEDDEVAATAIAENDEVAATAIAEDDEEGLLPMAEASASAEDVISDVESYFAEWDRKSSSKSRESESSATEMEKAASSADAVPTPVEDTEASEASASEPAVVATFALVSEPFAPTPNEMGGPSACVATEGEVEAAAGVRASFTSKDDQDLQTAFGRFLGEDADEPSEDLSALISATREPVQTGLRPAASNGVPRAAIGLIAAINQTPRAPSNEQTCPDVAQKDALTPLERPFRGETSVRQADRCSGGGAEPQLELDLVPGTKQLELTRHAPSPAASTTLGASEASTRREVAPRVEMSTTTLDTAWTAVSVDPHSSDAPEALVLALDSLDDAFDEPIAFTPSAPAADVHVVITGDEPLARSPSALEPSDLETMHAALAAFDEPIEFTPSPPVAEAEERIELTPSAAIADALAAEAELANAEAELLADPVSEEDVPAENEAIVEAVAALDDLFDTDESDWHTPVSQVAVRHEEKASWERPPHDDRFDDPEADIATRRLVLAEDEADDEDADEETISLSVARSDERNADDAARAPDQTEAGSDSFRVPRPDAFEDGTDNHEGDASLEPLSLELTPPPPGVGGWDRLVDFVAGFLLVRSATRAAALLPELLEGRRVNLSRLPEDTIAALCAEGIAARKPDGTFPTASFRQQANALHLDFMSGRAPAKDLIQWLSVAVRALLGNTVSTAAAHAHLEQAGIAKLLQRAA